MRTLGLIGGISWVSTLDYYRLINTGINQRLGGLNFAQCVLYSFNYADIKANNDADDWDANFRLVSRACDYLKSAGAEAIVLCANTMHLIADKVEANCQLPVIHIATATAAAVKEQGLNKVGLLGTRFTMERDFYRTKFTDQGIEVITPELEDRHFLHDTIFEELGREIFKKETENRYLQIIEQLEKRGAEGIILGCTEIPLLIKANQVRVPVFDTTFYHAEAAVNFALS